MSIAGTTSGLPQRHPALDRIFWLSFLWWRGLLVLAAVTAVCFSQFDRTVFASAFAKWPQAQTPTLESRFSTWDTAHYLILSEQGYEPASPSCAFYPLWPAVIHVGTLLMTGSQQVVAGVVLANTLSLLGFWMLYRLLGHRYGPNVSRDALILMLAFPGALFFAFPYSESFYFVIVMLFFWGLELRRWRWVAVACFLLPLARPVGVLVLLPLAWRLWETRGIGSSARTQKQSDATPQSHGQTEGILAQRRTGGNNRWLRFSTKCAALWHGTARARGEMSGATHCGAEPSATGGAATVVDQPSPPASALMPLRLGVSTKARGAARWLLLLWPLLGYASYFGVIWLWTGNAVEGFDAQRAYPNSPSIGNMFDCVGFFHAFLDIRSLDGMMDSMVDRLFFLLFLALLPFVYRLDKTWFFYVLAAGLVPGLTSWFMSYRRYIMVLFPLFVVLAQLLARARQRWIFWYYVVLLGLLQLWAVKQFINFDWAG